MNSYPQNEGAPMKNLYLSAVLCWDFFVLSLTTHPLSGHLGSAPASLALLTVALHIGLFLP